MLRILLLVGVLAAVGEHSSAAELSKKAKTKSRNWPTPGELDSNDLVGTWKVEPSTFYVCEELAKSSLQEIWTNYSAFGLTLKKDGSLIATNVPAKQFFDDWPATATKIGYWNMSTNSVEGVSGPNHTMHTNSNLSLNLLLLRTSVVNWGTNAGAWGRFIEWYQMSPAAPRTPAVILDGPRNKSGFICWSVLITKQN